ncbi:hypothetical protein MM221_11325 [Salipaludibacillus sp. LMS25]|jgi:hypothetical protein|uniref:RAxF-45 family protein n=1 Tax=Salipaludibacillus sp. LMS25 TaxID=2924031 RepID=UPI0020D0EA35|nr:RAxF-45 family protein [Salipaludibacillus sp. LMS25]UTR13242.1 hypothetical protein MM221_11325 [Salipaludibacillus sp. LMS25]
MNQAVFNIARQRYVTFLYIVRAVFYAVAFKGGRLPFFSNFIKNNKTVRASLSQDIIRTSDVGELT